MIGRSSGQRQEYVSTLILFYALVRWNKVQEQQKSGKANLKTLRCIHHVKMQWPSMENQLNLSGKIPRIFNIVHSPRDPERLDTEEYPSQRNSKSESSSCQCSMTSCGNQVIGLHLKRRESQGLREELPSRTLDVSWSRLRNEMVRIVLTIKRQSGISQQIRWYNNSKKPPSQRRTWTWCVSVQLRLRAPDRLCEVMALAKRTGADVACLQGTLFDGVGEWTKHGYQFFSLNQKDGCMVAVRTKFLRTQIRCVHHELFIVFRLQCGVARHAGDACFISACAPISNERTQTSTTEALRIEFWRKPNGVIRQVPNRCRVILCMDANGEVDTTLPWIGCAGSRICDQRKMWTHIGHELLEMLRSSQLVAISTHGEANRQCWT